MNRSPWLARVSDHSHCYYVQWCIVIKFLMHKTVLQILNSFIFLNFWPDVTGNTDSMNSCQGNIFRQFITQSVRLNILHQPLSWSCNATVFNTILPRLPVGKNAGPNCYRARCAGDGEAIAVIAPYLFQLLLNLRGPLDDRSSDSILHHPYVRIHRL